MTKHKATKTNYCINCNNLRRPKIQGTHLFIICSFYDLFFEILFKIKFDIPNSIDIGGAVDLHRGGGFTQGRWIYIGTVGRWIYIGTVGRWIYIGTVGWWIYIGAVDLHRGGGAVDLQSAQIVRGSSELTERSEDNLNKPRTICPGSELLTEFKLLLRTKKQ